MQKTSVEIKKELFKNFVNQTINSELNTLGNVFVFLIAGTIALAFGFALFLGTQNTEINIKWVSFLFKLLIFFIIITSLLLLYLLYKAKKMRKRYESIKEEDKEFFIKERYTHKIKALRGEVIDNIKKTKAELDRYGEDLEYYQNLINENEKV